VANSEQTIRLAPSRSKPASRPNPRGPRALADPSELTAADRELAQVAAAKADIRAFAPLYEAYVDLVWRYAVNRLGDHQRAADATSLTFQRALSALPTFAPQRRGDGTTFRSWLMTIARNVVIDETRRHRPTSNLDDPAAERWLVDHRRGPEAHAVAADERRRVEQALTQLPATQRQVVELRLAGFKVREVADLLEMTEPAVKTAHFRACARLRDLLAEPEDNGAPR
jgi:RNA polymerase sigma-70 factor (ECF subfamily)